MYILGKCISKYLKNKLNILNYIFCHFEFVVCFALLLYEVERNIVLDLGSTADSVKSKRERGGHTDTPRFVVRGSTRVSGRDRFNLLRFYAVGY